MGHLKPKQYAGKRRMGSEIKLVILGAGQLGLAIMDGLAAENQPVRLANRSGVMSEIDAGLVRPEGDPVEIAVGRINIEVGDQ